jgi:transcription initiation factor IIE alpha subunit
MKKNSKTLDWKLNDIFYNIIKLRFKDLQKKLEKNLVDKSTLKFLCSKCKTIYTVEKAGHLGYKCNVCEERPVLDEMKKE